MAKRYTAVLEIHEVEEGGTVTKPTSEKREIARVIVRAESLDKLVDKIGKHTALIEED